jgi:alcohol dehydrogenase, propanol-preferring
MGNIPQEHPAAVKQGAGEDATAPVKNVPTPQPGPGQILVKINWTGLCASDKSLLHDDWQSFGIKMQDVTNGIAGHEGAGEVVAASKEVEDIWKVGDRAGVKWVVQVCGHCEFCTNGSDELHCPNQKNSGFSMPGTFQVCCQHVQLQILNTYVISNTC